MDTDEELELDDEEVLNEEEDIPEADVRTVMVEGKLATIILPPKSGKKIG